MTLTIVSWRQYTRIVNTCLFLLADVECTAMHIGRMRGEVDGVKRVENGRQLLLLWLLCIAVSSHARQSCEFWILLFDRHTKTHSEHVELFVPQGIRRIGANDDVARVCRLYVLATGHRRRRGGCAWR